MVVNSTKVKTEALLLFCRDLIESYKETKDSSFVMDEDITKFIDTRIEDLLKAINVSVQPIPYYIRNSRVSRISIILKTYELINQKVSKILRDGQRFNPSMLCFTLLSTWFAEFGACESDKEFIYFTIYPYSEIFDKLILETPDPEYKKLNISMLDISESVIKELNSYRFK